VERVEGERLEARPGGGGAQVRRQPVTERRHAGPYSGVRAVQTEHLPELPPDSEERADGYIRAVRRDVGSDQLHHPGEVLRAADPERRHRLELDHVPLGRHDLPPQNMVRRGEGTQPQPQQVSMHDRYGPTQWPRTLLERASRELLGRACIRLTESNLEGIRIV